MAENRAEQNESLTELVKQLKANQGQEKIDLIRHSETLHQVRDFAQAQATENQKITAATMRGEDLEKLTLLDPLTDLYNHRTFIKELKAELGRARRYQHSVALCIIGIDHFDEMDKQYGELANDAILKIIASVIKYSIREVDISARYDKQRFVVALSKSGVSAGALVAERIRQRIGAQAISYNWENFSLTASFGVAAYPEQADEWDSLIAHALDAMEHATTRGGDRVLAI